MRGIIAFIRSDVEIRFKMPDEPSKVTTLDTTGLVCPEPVMLLHKAVRALPSGSELEILATDPSTQRDIPKFCEFLGHKLKKQEIRGEGSSGQQFYYLIEKA